MIKSGRYQWRKHEWLHKWFWCYCLASKAKSKTGKENLLPSCSPKLIPTESNVNKPTNPQGFWKVSVNNYNTGQGGGETSFLNMTGENRFDHKKVLKPLHSKPVGENTVNKKSLYKEIQKVQQRMRWSAVSLASRAGTRLRQVVGGGCKIEAGF